MASLSVSAVDFDPGILMDGTLMDIVLDLGVSVVQENFSFRGRDESGRVGVWPPSGRVLKTGGRTLWDKGYMVNKITKQRTSNTTGFIWSAAVSKQGFPYPAIHEFGSEKKNIPQRRWLVWPAPELDGIPDAIEKLING